MEKPSSLQENIPPSSALQESELRALLVTLNLIAADAELPLETLRLIYAARTISNTLRDKLYPAEFVDSALAGDTTDLENWIEDNRAGLSDDSLGFA